MSQVLDPAQRLESRLQSEGTKQLIEGNTPLLLDDPESVWIVESGAVEVFAVELAGGEPAGARYFVFTARPGAALFGLDLAKDGSGLGLLAVGTVNTQLLKVPVDSLLGQATDPDLREQVVDLIEGWVAGLTGGLTDGQSLQTDLQIVPREPLTLAQGQRARPQKGVVWVTLEEGEALFLGQAGLGARLVGRPFPLAEAAWLQAGGPAKLSAAGTPEIVTADGLRQDLAIYHRSILEAQRQRLTAAVAAEADRLQDEIAYERAIRQRALTDLAEVLDRRATAERVPIAPDPLLVACRLVGAADGIEIQSPPRQEGEQRRDPLTLIAKASRVRLRQVRLTSTWWRNESGPMLGFTAEGRRPVALLPVGQVGRRGFELVDPGAGTRTRVNWESAAGLAADAWVFYRPFPDRVIGVRDVLTFGLRGCRDDLAWVVVFGALIGLLATFTPIATGIIFDTLIPQALGSRLIQLAIALVLAAIAGAFFQIIRGIAIMRIEAKIDASVQAAVWDRLLSLPTTFFRDYSAGDLANRAMGIDQIRQILTGTTITSILASIFSIISFGVLFYYDLKLALVAAVLSLIASAMTVLSSWIQLGYQRRLTTVQGRISGMVFQFLTGIAKLRVAGAEARAFSVWAGAFAEQKRLSFRAQVVSALFSVFSSSWPIVATLIIFATVAPSVTSAQPALSTGSFLAFLAAFSQFLVAMLTTGVAINSILQCIPLYERARPIFRTLPEVDVAKTDPGVLSGAIEVSHVAFRYRSDLPLVLHDVSLQIRPGEFVALVGPSGAGKSSILRLLLGFDSPESGSIYYDGHDLAGLDTEAVRRQMGVVTQDSKVMAGTIFANIIGSAVLSQDDAWEAARLAGIDEDIRTMPMGMYTYISEGGSTFSGGQLQRLMIARAIAGKPRILLFDEATSALDNRTQAIVSRSLETLQATRIAIAHRLSTIQKADRIFVIVAGRIVQAGTFSDLMATPGPFADLARRQLA